MRVTSPADLERRRSRYSGEVIIVVAVVVPKNLKARREAMVHGHATRRERINAFQDRLKSSYGRKAGECTRYISVPIPATLQSLI